MTPCCHWASGRGVSSCFPLVHSVPRCLWGVCPVSGPCLSGSCGPVADQLYWVPPGRDCRPGSPPGLAALCGGDQAQRCPDGHLWAAACSVACALSGRFMSACWGQCLVAADPCPPQGSCVPGAAGERGASGGRAGWQAVPWAPGLTLGPFPRQFLECSVVGNCILSYTEAQKSCSDGVWNHSVFFAWVP